MESSEKRELEQLIILSVTGHRSRFDADCNYALQDAAVVVDGVEQQQQQQSENSNAEVAAETYTSPYQVDEYLLPDDIFDGDCSLSHLAFSPSFSFLFLPFLVMHFVLFFV